MSDEPLTRRGVWYLTSAMSAPESVTFAKRIESLGYSTLWLPEATSRDPFAHIALLLAETDSLTLATGIANIHHRHPGVMVQAAETLAEASDGRFVLGLGVSHAPIVSGVRNLDYARPFTAMKRYLDGMDESVYTGPKAPDRPVRLLAALGPRMLELAAERADGAHPYLTTPDHTAQARKILGPDKHLCVEQKVVLCSDPTVARRAAINVIEPYSALPNYRNNWKRLGFSEEEIAGYSDRFVDAIVAWGDAAKIEERLTSHSEAGATHICIQPVATDGSFGIPDWDCLEALSPE